jgi:hypothetical protein
MELRRCSWGRTFYALSPATARRYTQLSNDRTRMSSPDTAEISRQLVTLKVEHRDLDEVIDRLIADGGTNEFQLKRLKKRKLKLKDMITYLESKLIPDLDA